MGCNAACKRSTIQEKNHTLDTPSKTIIMTTDTLELLLSKLPETERKAFRVPDITHDLIAGGELVDEGCRTYFYTHSAEIEYEGETLYRGWRDNPTRFWRFDITSKGGNRVTPDTAPEEYDPSNGGFFEKIKHCVNSIYECTNKEQLIKYYHTSLGSHPKTTLIEAAKAGCLKGCPIMDAQSISKFIGVEEMT